MSILLEQPACARFIAAKLHKYFVNDAPTPPKDAGDAVERLAREFRAKRYEIRPVLRMLFRSRHFHAPANRLSVVKSPVQLMVQTIRSLGTPVREMGALVQAGDLMGQQLFQPPSVKGWDGGRSWINTATLFVRQNVAVYLVTGRSPQAFDWDPSDAAYDASHLLDGLRDAAGSVDAREAVRNLSSFVLGAPPSPARLAQFESFLEELNGGGALTPDRVKALLCLLCATPEYQLC